MTTRAKGGNRLGFSSYEWMIAFRYMLPNKKQIFTSVISIISLIGIMLGVFALIVVMAVMNGFRTELLDRILGMNGHLVIQAIDSDFTDYNTLIPRIEGVDGVKFALPVIEGQALAQGDATGGTGALVRGVRKQDLDKLTTVTKNIKFGSLEDFDKQDGVAIGSGMAEKLGLSVGSDIRIITPDGDVTPFGVNPRVKAYKVSAIFNVGMSEYDTIFVFMPLKEAQAFFNLGNKVQSLEIFLNNPDAVSSITPEIEKTVGRQVYSIDWRSRNQAFFSALQVVEYHFGSHHVGQGQGARYCYFEDYGSKTERRHAHIYHDGHGHWSDRNNLRTSVRCADMREYRPYSGFCVLAV